MTEQLVDTPNARQGDSGVSGPDARRGLSVVTPLFNEAECVERLVDTLETLDKSLGHLYRFEFVFVDDASTDDTHSKIVAEADGRLRHKLVRHKQNRGIAAAIWTGLEAAEEDLAASIDADLSYDPAVIAELAPLVRGPVVLATASPYHPQGEVLQLPAWRIAVSRAASHVYRWITPQRLTCYTCCVRVYDRAAVLACPIQNDGFVGVAELAWSVMRRGGQIAEAPAVLRPRQAGASKMRTARATLHHLRLIGRILVDRFSRTQPLPLPTPASASRATLNERH